MDGNVWTGCPPAEISLGTDKAPGEACRLTDPINNTAAATEPRVRLPTDGKGGDWVDHDVQDPAITAAAFFTATLSALALDEHAVVADALQDVPTSAQQETLRNLLAATRGVGALVAVRTQVVRGVHVQLQLALSAGVLLEVHTIHDAVHRTSTITQAEVL